MNVLQKGNVWANRCGWVHRGIPLPAETETGFLAWAWGGGEGWAGEMEKGLGMCQPWWLGGMFQAQDRQSWAGPEAFLNLSPSQNR